MIGRRKLVFFEFGLTDSFYGRKFFEVYFRFQNFRAQVRVVQHFSNWSQFRLFCYLCRHHFRNHWNHEYYWDYFIHFYNLNIWNKRWNKLLVCSIYINNYGGAVLGIARFKRLLEIIITVSLFEPNLAYIHAVWY